MVKPIRRVTTDWGKLHRKIFGDTYYMTDIDWLIYNHEGNIVRPIAIIEVTQIDRRLELKQSQLKAIKTLANKAKIKVFLILYDKGFESFAIFDLNKYPIERMSKLELEACLEKEFIILDEGGNYTVKPPGRKLNRKEFIEFESRLRGIKIERKTNNQPNKTDKELTLEDFL